jgi:hypothetical protein
VSSRAKLLAAIRNNPRDVRFDDACKVAGWLGFVAKGGKGAHRAFQRPGEAVGLNFQDRNGKIKPYQAKQLIEMIDKYAGEDAASE